MKATAPLFPLPLVPFELFMLLDDRPSFPMTFPLQAEFLGEIHQEAMHLALQRALKRHPLLDAHVVRGSDGPCWVPAETAQPEIDWGPLERPCYTPGGEGIDLSRETALRAWVRTDASASRLVLQFHHCACDGIGSLQFLGDLLSHYAIEVAGPDAATMIDLAPDLLRTRDRWKSTPKPESSSLRLVWDVFREGVGVLANKPAVLRSPRTAPIDPTRDFPDVHARTIDGQLFRKLRQAAQAQTATLNDLLLRDCFLMLAQSPLDSKATRHCIRVLMPTSLREAGDERMPAANALGYALLTRTIADGQDPDELLASIREETAEIRRWNLGVFFLDSVRWAARFPWLTRRLLSNSRGFATCVLTNVGDPVRRFTARLPRRDGKTICGNLHLTRITGTPPLRPRTHIVISAVTYGGDLTIGMRCDPHSFSKEETDSLLEQFVDRLRISARASA